MMLKPTCRLLALSLASLTALPLANANDGSVYQFLEADRQKNNPNAMRQYEQSMQGTLFGMYPTYWRMNYNLSSQSPDAVNEFVRQYPRNVMSEKLAADYAETKAREGDYASVRAVANSIENADASEACAIALGYNQSTADSMRALYQKPNVWLNTQIKQSLCDKLASEMSYNPRINQTDKHEQLIRMMRIDKRQLSSKNPAIDKTADIVSLSNQLGLNINYGTLQEVRNNPQGFLGRFQTEAFSQTNQYLYVYAISLLAHRSHWEAANQLTHDIAIDDRRPNHLISDMARRYAWRSIAVKRMNVNTDEGFSRDAISWFQNSLGEPFNFEESEDYAQAAIHFGQWQDVINAIGTMSVVTQQENIWQYWLARAYEQTGKAGQARTIYTSLAKEIDYYGLLAKDRLGQKLTLNDIGGNTLPALSSQQEQQVMANPYFARAFLLMQNNASLEHINREWNWAVRMAKETGNTQLVLHAAKMAHDKGYYHRSIHAIENTPNLRNAALSHPMPYSDSVIRHSRNVGIDPAWAYGIMRQESRFQPAARSGAAASGLMQIIPGTAAQIARGMGESTGNMGDADTNIRYGTWFLNDLANRAGGQIAVATAGYNAGPNAAKKWLPAYGNISADQYVEAIPYGETRAYVKHVMENATIYGALLGNYLPISQRMGVVRPY
ncbi:lytic transglycosylase domain-containing protein [Moraxella sp.]|uniref:lytic transglycosylase domain-containing protein n=1 Tax=Moraxella sp. TaxID=479 RepID=UPI0026DDBCEC|nr:lytic transglycosylase domain-containing protein [Moraxella sp.]MDO4895168.1 lytic transglycosylase domain-containing protein [Moraxella sp.]